MENVLRIVANFCINAGIKLIIALLVLVIGLKISKIITNKFIKSKSMRKVDPSVQSFISNVILIALDALVVVSAALIIGIPAASFIALLGTAGVAIGLALQGAFSNFAGGIMILIFRPFKVGDYIDYSGLSGTVLDISIFYTVLCTIDNKHITIPNGTLMNSSVINYSAEKTRRLDIDFNVSYDSDIEKVKSIILDKTNAHSAALQDPAPFCRLTNQGESALTFTLRVWCDSADYWQLKFDLLEGIRKDFDKNGISIPFPQLDVHLDK